MKSFKDHIKTSGSKGDVNIIVGPDGPGKYEVHHSMPRRSPRGRAPKSKVISTHSTLDAAKEAAKEFAEKQGAKI